MVYHISLFSPACCVSRGCVSSAGYPVLLVVGGAVLLVHCMVDSCLHMGEKLHVVFTLACPDGSILLYTPCSMVRRTRVSDCLCNCICGKIYESSATASSAPFH
eukprot:jgi/Ulvmu1/6860/UM031_0065.1